MGFLKFLKREKKESLDELDLPPAPPPLEGFEEEMPELPEFPQFPELEEELSSGIKEMPEFELPTEEENVSESKQDVLPELPYFELKEQPIIPIHPIRAPSIEPMPQSPQPLTLPQQIPQEEPKFIFKETYPKIDESVFLKEKKPIRVMPSGKSVYVRVDMFKATLGNINIVRGDLRKADEALVKLETIKNAKDKSLDRIRSLLDDLQRKLIFIDKTLFKGE